MPTRRTGSNECRCASSSSFSARKKRAAWDTTAAMIDAMTAATTGAAHRHAMTVVRARAGSQLLPRWPAAAAVPRSRLRGGRLARPSPAGAAARLSLGPDRHGLCAGRHRHRHHRVDFAEPLSALKGPRGRPPGAGKLAAFDTARSMVVAPTAHQAFELKSATLSLVAVVLKTTDMAQVSHALDERFGDAPGLFDQDPVVIDLSHVRDSLEPIDFVVLTQLLRLHKMLPVAVRSGNSQQLEDALTAGLSETHGATAPALPVRNFTPEDVAAPAPPQLAPEPPAPLRTSMIIDKPLRSGQRVYAKGADLVVLAVVSHGAEVIADGSIHVYAPLRGRATGRRLGRHRSAHLRHLHGAAIALHRRHLPNHRNRAARPTCWASRRRSRLQRREARRAAARHRLPIHLHSPRRHQPTRTPDPWPRSSS